MKVDVLAKDNDSVTLLVRGANRAFMNALRRAIIAEIPTFAIEDVYVYENSSSIWDEYIAHRLGLIPLSAKWGTYTKESEVRFSLEKQGPGTVFSGDLKPLDKGVAVVDPEIPIVKLRADQRIRMECVAKVGTAKEHAKWQAGLASFRPVVRAKIKDANAVKAAGIDPKRVEEESKRPEGLSSDLYNLLDDLVLKQPDAVEIEKKSDAFIFYAETYGNLGLKEMILAATDVLEKKVEEFVKQVKA